MTTRTAMITFLLLLAAAFLLSACSGSSNNSVVVAHDSLATDASTTTVVTITNYSGKRIANAPVVLGDSDGVMISHGLTDGNGQITFSNSPANSTVTAAYTCLQSGATTSTYSINVQYDVNGSVVMSLNDCETTSPGGFIPPPAPGTTLGTVIVNVSAIPSDVSYYMLSIGSEFSYNNSLVTSQTITIRQNDLNSDGTISILAIGYNRYGEAVAYSILQNQAFSDGMTADLQMGPMAQLLFSITNLPSTAVALDAYIYMYGSSGLYFPSKTYGLSSAPSSTTISMPYIPSTGNATSYNLSVRLDQDHDGVADSSQSVSRYTPMAPANQNFDLSSVLAAPALQVSGPNTARPTFKWSGADPAADTMELSANLKCSYGSMYIYVNRFMRSRTSISFPQLPDSLAEFRPTGVQSASIYTSAYGQDQSFSSTGYYNVP